MENKSCATCKNSAFDNGRNGFRITNAGCETCKNYNEWIPDNLSDRERFEQEKEQI